MAKSALVAQTLHNSTITCKHTFKVHRTQTDLFLVVYLLACLKLGDVWLNIYAILIHSFVLRYLLP